MAQAKGKLTRKDGKYYRNGKRVAAPGNAPAKGSRKAAKKTGSTDSG